MSQAVCVVMTVPSASAHCVLTTAPGDYQAVAGLTVTIQPEAGAENVSVTMAIVEDLVLEGPEEFSLVVEAGGGRGVQVGGRDTLNITILEQQGTFASSP